MNMCRNCSMSVDPSVHGQLLTLPRACKISTKLESRS